MEDQKLAIAAGSGLVALNIGLMAALSMIPGLSDYFSLIWNYAIVGVIAFGAVLTVGNYLAKKGIKDQDKAKSLLGVILLMAAYGVFGAGIVTVLPVETMLAVLGVTAIITAFLALAIGAGVNYSDRDFGMAQKYSTYSFIGLLVTAGIGTFFAPILLLAFLFALAGFLLQMIYEFWHLQQATQDPLYHAIGLYVAVTGVFVHILQLVRQYYMRE